MGEEWDTPVVKEGNREVKEGLGEQWRPKYRNRQLESPALEEEYHQQSEAWVILVANILAIVMEEQLVKPTPKKMTDEKWVKIVGLDYSREMAQQGNCKISFNQTQDVMGLYGAAMSGNLESVGLQHEGTTKEKEMLEALASPSSEVFELGSPLQNKLDKIKASTNGQEEKYVNGLANRVEVHIVKPVGLILERAQSVQINFILKAQGKPGPIYHIVYEMDEESLGPTTHYTSSTDRWAVSNIGQPSDSNSPCYEGSSSSQFPAIDSELFQTARIPAGTLRYYGLDLENGNYTVKLQFAEIGILAPIKSMGLGWRVFHIYAKGKLDFIDFNLIKETDETPLRAVANTQCQWHHIKERVNLLRRVSIY
ncbi:Hypothetical predicted protein [Olea europaea subsp. europaea]|uniref:Malectin domain-containing protein n=1 Tax=Olea europaea subsp. europaea TaxID=158383 RepID=A0A8S0RYN2_OLEEU|nr:Hypothetical predicted protein [Olea europaea subsp. europaea]